MLKKNYNYVIKHASLDYYIKQLMTHLVTTKTILRDKTNDKNKIRYIYTTIYFSVK